ncbi:hypothetical protein B0T17DRAFT_321659 [Bombardia bombarda]|uniref:Uncharacterized protein n=1 Tax=Bombardia bombarda TaxID=252184 RepID=A0AA40BY21_9PEZI|nr:hypothetical protein B0T17DRAFT_321659 [Bombardia bombarda]
MTDKRTDGRAEKQKWLQSTSKKATNTTDRCICKPFLMECTVCVLYYNNCPPSSLRLGLARACGVSVDASFLKQCHFLCALPSEPPLITYYHDVDLHSMYACCVSADLSPLCLLPTSYLGTLSIFTSLRSGLWASPLRLLHLGRQRLFYQATICLLLHQITTTPRFTRGHFSFVSDSPRIRKDASSETRSAICFSRDHVVAFITWRHLA